MTPRSAEPETPPTPTERPNLIERIQARVRVTERRVRRIPLVQAIQRVLDTYALAGGGLTASGLSYGALFAVVPGLLLIVSLLVLVVDSPEVRQEVIDWITEQLPPLKEFAEDIVTGLAQSARVGTVFGLIGFLWGASGFYLGLEGAMERSFPGPKKREAILGRVRGVIAVVVVVGAVLVAFIANSAATVLWGVLGVDLGPLVPLITPLIAVVASTAVALIVYVIVPSDTPGWRAAFPPAVAAGIGMGLLTSLYSLVAQLLVGGFAGLGALTSVFAALIWFNWVFQILLYGAAWARLRRDRRHLKGVVR